VELVAALRRRRMVRAFAPDPIDPDLIDHLLDLSRRAPSAGNSQGVSFVVLEGSATAQYWDITLPAERRASFRWQQLLDAPVIVLVCTNPTRYVERYAEADKAKTGLGEAADCWPVPYWWVDAGAVAQNLLLLAVDQQLGACLFGPFDHEPAVAKHFRLPSQQRIVASIALGHPLVDEPGRSATRDRPPIGEIILRPPPDPPH